ncbi:hypothetical protein LHYA1_G005710 [Lachnellula hyalina]|uniref:BZIP domain-containing protein n=1 Tax=Lachnellula hyalina TaxID=1316788 RepID=A0A8H8QZ67_9HELO|nr:uncharacterized protein LHYA1_G005710 [Lachnellula hyalina]TVY25439.1 hypothetical protein LHYA1_G005710 [Lachnellula hyalina]
MSTGSEKANLARIRDNQRRSRARRKEYLQELEAKLRQCELQGIEASAEIQVAARRVADENKKLRGLLFQNGVAEDSIESYLNSSPATETAMGSQYGGNTGPAVQLLEQLLLNRKVCCTNSNIAQCDGVTGTGSRDSSTSVSTMQTTPWDIHQNPSTHQFMTPTSSAASKANSVSRGNDSNRGVPHHQRLVSMPRNLSPASNPNQSGHDSQIFDFNPLLQPQNPVSYSTSHQNSAQQHLQPYSAPHHQSSIYTPNTDASTNVNSCGLATDMIASMAGGDPASVRADLGCLPDMECEVDSHLVFNVMDRYMGDNG